MKYSLIACCAVLLAVSASAQTVTRSLEWDFQNKVVADLTGAVMTVKLDAAAPVQVSPTCAPVGPDLHCKMPIALASGPHTIVVTATDGGGAGSATLNYVPPGVLTPVNVTITIQITVP